jgi:hypothetical protein
VPQIAVTMASQIRNALRYFDMDLPAGRINRSSHYVKTAARNLGSPRWFAIPRRRDDWGRRGALGDGRGAEDPGLSAPQGSEVCATVDFSCRSLALRDVFVLRCTQADWINIMVTKRVSWYKRLKFESCQRGLPMRELQWQRGRPTAGN